MIPAGSPSLYSYEQKEKSACRFRLLIRAHLHYSSHFFTSQKTHVLRKQCIFRSAFRDKAYMLQRDVFSFSHLLHRCAMQVSCNSAMLHRLQQDRFCCIVRFQHRHGLKWNLIKTLHWFFTEFHGSDKEQGQVNKMKTAEMRREKDEENKGDVTGHYNLLTMQQKD